MWEQVEAVAAVKTHLLFVTGGEMNAKIGRHLVTCPRIVMKVNDVLLHHGPVRSPQRPHDAAHTAPVAGARAGGAQGVVTCG